MRRLVITLLAGLGLACSSSSEAVSTGDTAPPSSSSGPGQTGTTTPPSPCPPAYELRDGFCELREVFIAGGTFTMGRGACPVATPFEQDPVTVCPLTDEPRQVTVAPFYVDAAPSGQRRFPCSKESCQPGPMETGPRSPLFQTRLMTVVDDGVQLDDMCQAFGRRLIREDEWEFLVTAGGTRTYPWGDEPPTCERLWVGFEACPLPPPIFFNGSELSLTNSGIPILDHPPSPEGLYDLVHYLPHLVAPRPDIYSGDYTAIPYDFAHSKAIDDDFERPLCQGGPPTSCDFSCPYPAGGYPCKHRRAGVRGGRAMDQTIEPVNGSYILYERSVDAYRGAARAVAYEAPALVRCVRDAP